MGSLFTYVGFFFFFLNVCELLSHLSGLSCVCGLSLESQPPWLGYQTKESYHLFDSREGLWCNGLHLIRAVHVGFLISNDILSFECRSGPKRTWMDDIHP